MFEGADMDGYLSIGGTRWIVGAPRVLTDRSVQLMTTVARLAPGVSLSSPIAPRSEPGRW